VRQLQVPERADPGQAALRLHRLGLFARERGREIFSTAHSPCSSTKEKPPWFRTFHRKPCTLLRLLSLTLFAFCSGLLGFLLLLLLFLRLRLRL
jgi:hypothetical protein